MEGNAALYQLGAVALASLSGVIAILWKMIVKDRVETKERADALSEEVKDSKDKIIELSEQVGRVQGRQEGVEHMAASVLEEVRSAIGGV